jgi:hypothetical protein
VTAGPLGYVHEPYDHYGFSKGVANWIARHNEYSSAELDLLARLADEPLRIGDLFRRDPLRRRCLKRLAARAGFRPLFRFLYTYIVRGGFLDGRPGLYFCLLRVAHEIHITVKLAERRHATGRIPAARPEPDAAAPRPVSAAGAPLAADAQRLEL